MRGRRLAWLAGALVLALVATGAAPWPPPSARADDPKIPLVAIDPGHGGLDYGTSGTVRGGRLLEKELTLRVSKALAEALQKAGYRTLLIRGQDREVNSGEDRNGDGKVDTADDLQARVDRANQANATVLVSIHFNGSVDRSLRGPEIYYSPNRPFASDSRRLAESIMAATTARLAEAKRPIKPRGIFGDTVLGGHLYVLGPPGGRIVRASNMPGVLVEGMFLTNEADAALLAEDATIQALAKGYADGIAAYLGPPPKPGPRQARVAGRAGAYLRPAPLLATKPLTTLPTGATVELAELARGDRVAGAGYPHPSFGRVPGPSDGYPAGGAVRSGGDADWWRVDFQGQPGYVFARLLQPLTVAGAAKPATGPTPPGRSGPDAAPARPGESRPQDAEPGRRGTIATDDNLPARLRARPTRESPILARVRAGDSVRLLGEASGEAVGGGSSRWLKVQHGELVGWIWAPLID